MEKKRMYFIISSIVILILSFICIINVDSTIKATLDSLSKLPITLDQNMINALSKKAFYIIPNVISIIVGSIILWISVTNKIENSKKLFIGLGAVLFVCAGHSLVSILAIIDIIVISSIKGHTVKKEKKEIPKLERYSDGFRGIIVAIACFVIYFVYMFFVKPTGYVSSMLCAFIVVGIICLLFWKNIWRDLCIFRKSFKEYFLYVLPRIGIMYIIYFVFSILCFAVNKNISINQQQLNAMPKWYVLILSTTFAPIVEEVLFRGCIRRFIKNDWIFIIASGLLFGLLHTFDEGSVIMALIMAVPYSILGGGFAYIYAKTNNITNNILCHGFHNFVISLLHLFLF